MQAGLWITGAAGFSGRHLVDAVLALDDRPRIVGLDVTGQQASGADAWHRVDVTDVAAVADIARKDPPRWVIHLAGAMPPASEGRMWHLNVGGTVGLLRGLGQAGCEGVRVVSVGSAAEFLHPDGGLLTEDSPCGGTTPYGHTKWAQTVLALRLGRELGIPTMVARTFNLVGPGLSPNLVVGSLCGQFAQADPPEVIEVGNTRAARDFIDVRDAVRAYWAVAQRGEPHETYNVSSGVATTIDQVLQHFRQLTGRSPQLQVNPARLRDADPPVSYGERSKVERVVGWRPVIPLVDSLAAMLAAAGQQAQSARAAHQVR